MTQNPALVQLTENAKQIYQLISKQKTHLCLAKCPAFEEIIDTQLFGLSKQVDFAVSLRLIHANEGHKIMAELEYALNDMYTQVYEESRQN